MTDADDRDAELERLRAALAAARHENERLRRQLAHAQARLPRPRGLDRALDDDGDDVPPAGGFVSSW